VAWDSQSGSDSTCTKYLSCQGVPAVASSFLLCRCSFCMSNAQSESASALSEPPRTDLDLCLLPTGKFIVPCPYPLRHEFPQLAGLPLALLLDRLDVTSSLGPVTSTNTSPVPTYRLFVLDLGYRVPQAVRDTVVAPVGPTSVALYWCDLPPKYPLPLYSMVAVYPVDETM
jgi:hypothetical protein